MNDYYALVLHPTESRFLAVVDGERVELPVASASARWTPEVGEFLPALEATLGRPLCVRQCLHLDIDRSMSPPGRKALYLCTAADAPRAETAAVWLPSSRLGSLSDAWCRKRVADAMPFHGATDSGIDHTRTRTAPWNHPDWYDGVRVWLAAALRAAGATARGRPRQMRQWDLSALLTVESDTGRMYVKCVPHFFAHEPMLTERLAALFRDWVPRPMASFQHADEGRMLLADFGGTLVRRTAQPALGMQEPLRQLAQMQLRCATASADLIRSGCVQRPLAMLPRDVERVLADPLTHEVVDPTALATLTARHSALEIDCERLADLGLPETLVHGDFHNGNVAVAADRHVIFDWSDGAVSHAFFDLPIALGAPEHWASRAEQQVLLRAYLEPWREAGYSDDRLDAACDLALKLGLFYHAVSYHRILQACGQATRAELAPALRALLELAARS